MKRIAQTDENGCGIACVAMIAGVSYDEAKSIIFPNGNIKKTNHAELRSALAHFGLTLGNGRRLSKTSFKDLTYDGLLWTYITWDNEDWKHWMVWDAKTHAVIDPYDGDISKRSYRFVSIFEVQRPKSPRKTKPVLPR